MQQLAVGPLTVIKSPPELPAMEKTFTEVKPGGKGCPTDCVARHRVAIIIPFRDRPKHLQALLYNLHPMLLRQQIDYQIFVVEQKGERDLLQSACRSPNDGALLLSPLFVYRSIRHVTQAGRREFVETREYLVGPRCTCTVQETAGAEALETQR